jgi:hypothetical protein
MRGEHSYLILHNMKIDDIRPILEPLEKTEKLVANQGYSYNEAGISYNQIGVQYGGLYGNESQNPTIQIDDTKPL